MGGVIFLANATIQLQPSFAASYTIITVCYCIGATLPPADHWNPTRLTFSDIRMGDERPLPGRIQEIMYTLSYTEAWWKPIVIAETKTCVKKACWAPKTPTWDD